MYHLIVYLIKLYRIIIIKYKLYKYKLWKKHNKKELERLDDESKQQKLNEEKQLMERIRRANESKTRLPPCSKLQDNNLIIYLEDRVNRGLSIDMDCEKIVYKIEPNIDFKPYGRSFITMEAAFTVKR